MLTTISNKLRSIEYIVTDNQMEQPKKSTKEDIREIERRHYECLRKFDKIVDQFDDLMDAMDPITQLPKRRKTSKRQGKKASSSSSAPAADEATSNAPDVEERSNVSEKTSALEQIISKHLDDLHSHQPVEPSS